MRKLSALLLALMAATALAGEVPPQYNTSCTFCHAAGAAGAPRTGDSKAWATRMDKGMDTLVENVVNGMNAMPPKGMCANCSADDIEALIVYMAGDAAASKE